MPLASKIAGNRGRYTVIDDEDGIVIFKLHDVDQEHSFEMAPAASPGTTQAIRVRWPNELPSEPGTISVSPDGTMEFRTPDTYQADLSESLALTGFPDTQDALNFTNASINNILAALKAAGIMRADDVAVTPTVAEAVTDAVMNYITPEPATAGTEAEILDIDNGILAEARCICVDPTVIIA